MATSSPLPRSVSVALTAAITVLLVAIAVLAPLPIECPAGVGDDETHLLCAVRSAQPFGPLVFVAIPLLGLATLLITDLMILFDGSRAQGWVRTASRAIGLAAGPFMVGLAATIAAHVGRHLLTHSASNPLDLLAFVAYLACAVPAVIITLVELQVLGDDRRSARRLHARASGIALILAIVAVTCGIFAMPGAH